MMSTKDIDNTLKTKGVGFGQGAKATAFARKILKKVVRRKRRRMSDSLTAS